MRSLISLLSISFLVSCATTKFNKDQVAGVKTVAIVGHLLTQDKVVDVEEAKDNVKDGLMNTALSMLGADTSEDSSPMMMEENPSIVSAHSGAVYDNFVKQLNKNTNWKVLDAAKLSKNATYTKMLKEAEEKYWYVNSRGSAKIQKFTTASSFHPQSIKLMSFEEREELINALGVDAIAAIDYTTKISTTEILGKDIEATSKAQFHLFKKGVKDAVVVMDYQGEATADSKATRGILGYANDKKAVNSLILQSTFSSNDKLINDLKTQVTTL